jgi:hypothetical protein
VTPKESTPVLVVAEVPARLLHGPQERGPLRLQPADEQILALARHARYQLAVLPTTWQCADESRPKGVSP